MALPAVSLSANKLPLILVDEPPVIRESPIISIVCAPFIPAPAIPFPLQYFGSEPGQKALVVWISPPWTSEFSI